MPSPDNESISQLFTYCLEGNVIKFNELIHTTNNKKKSTQSKINPFVEYTTKFDIKSYKILKPTPNLTKKKTISLLDAAILSNSSSMIDTVVTLLSTGQINNEDQQQQQQQQQQYIQRLYTQLLQSNIITFQQFELGILTSNLQSIQHLYQYCPQLYQPKTQIEKDRLKFFYSTFYQNNMDILTYLFNTYNLTSYTIIEPNNQEYFLLQAIKTNNYELVTLLSKIIDINIHSKNQEPPMCVAIRLKQWKMVQLLIEHGTILINDHWRRSDRNIALSILHEVVQDLNIDTSFIDLLLLQPNITIEQSGSDGVTPLLSAAEVGNIHIVQHLVGNHDANVHVKNQNGCNLFHYAIFASEKCTIELLNTIHLLGVDINVLDKDNASPLAYAIYDDNVKFECIQKLIEFGANVITINDTSQYPFKNQPISALFQAIKRDEDDSKLFTYLFSFAMKQTPTQVPIQRLVYEGVLNNNIAAIKYIVENYRQELEQNVINNNRNGQSRSQNVSKDSKSASKNNNQHEELYDIIDRYIMHHNKSIQLCHLFHIFEYLLEHNIITGFFNFQKQYGFQNLSLLLYFADDSQSPLHLLQLCVEKGADIYKVDDNGYNILHILLNAVRYQSNNDIMSNTIAKFNYFISLGLDVNSITTNGETPLIFATQNNTPQLITHLIQQHGADINIGFLAVTSPQAMTYPFHYVSNLDMVKLFVSQSNINFRYDSGDTHLSILLLLRTDFDYSIYCKSLSYLIHECGADVNTVNNNGNTPLHIVLSTHFTSQPIDIIHHIIQHQNISILNTVNNKNQTPLQLALKLYCSLSGFYRQKVITLVQLLLQHHASPIFQQGTFLHERIKQLDHTGFWQIDSADETETINHIQFMIDLCIDNIDFYIQ